MAVYRDNFARFPSELIGEEIFRGVLGGINALNNSVFPYYRIQPACDNFGMIHHFFFSIFVFLGSKAAWSVRQNILKNIWQCH
jgi:hypothetical protein